MGIALCHQASEKFSHFAESVSPGDGAQRSRSPEGSGARGAGGVGGPLASPRPPCVPLQTSVAAALLHRSIHPAAFPSPRPECVPTAVRALTTSGPVSGPGRPLSSPAACRPALLRGLLGPSRRHDHLLPSSASSATVHVFTHTRDLTDIPHTAQGALHTQGWLTSDPVPRTQCSGIRAFSSQAALSSCLGKAASEWGRHLQAGLVL